MAYLRCNSGGGTIKKIGSGIGSATFDISDYPGATVDNFIVAIKDTLYNVQTGVSDAFSLTRNVGKSISGNTLTVSLTSSYECWYKWSVTTTKYASEPFDVYYVEEVE